MKLIDLLNKIAKGEEVPKKIKIEDDELYFSEYKNTYVFEDGGDLNWCYYVTHKILNTEVEIIEGKPKPIEELKDDDSIWEEQAKDIDYIFLDKINELSKAVNYLLDKDE
jgi:hypothetical protein